MSSLADSALSKGAQDKITQITNAAQSGSMSWAEANQAANAVRASEGANYTVSGSGHTSWDDGSSLSSYKTGSVYTPAPVQPVQNQMDQYLKDMYAQNTAAQLAALKGTYEKNAAELSANAAKIPATYTAAKNEAAAQNEVAKQSFNEYAAARGLNTGTSGQAALANSSVLQGNLSGINTAQADALSENALEQDKLAIAYKNAVDQATASGNSELASALYQEYVRQSEAAAAAKQAAQEQANWETSFNYGKESDTKNYAYNLAMTMLQAGTMPDASTLQAAGITTADAMNVRLAALQSAKNSTDGTSPKATAKPTLTYAQMMQAIEDGNITSNVKSAYQYYMGEEYGGVPQANDLSELDTDQFTNRHTSDMVQVKTQSGAYVSYTWAAAMKLVEQGRLKAAKNGDGTYTLI